MGILLLRLLEKLQFLIGIPFDSYRFNLTFFDNYEHVSFQFLIGILFDSYKRFEQHFMSKETFQFLIGILFDSYNTHAKDNPKNQTSFNSL